MTSDRIFTAGDLSGLINMITGSTGNELPNVWRSVVSKIGKKNDEIPGEENITLGEKLAANSHVVDLKNGVLLVEANHSGWIQYLKFNQKFILQGLKWALPDLQIKGLAFRVAGSSANLSDTYENQVKKARSELDAKIEKQEKELAQLENKQLVQKNEEKTSEGLPPEMLERFERLKNSMLTNSKE